jgi:hypothetical protein
VLLLKTTPFPARGLLLATLRPVSRISALSLPVVDDAWR